MLNLFSAQFLRDNGKADSDSIMRAKATVAFHNQNFKVKSRLIIATENKLQKFLNRSCKHSFLANLVNFVWPKSIFDQSRDFIFCQAL